MGFEKLNNPLLAKSLLVNPEDFVTKKQYTPFSELQDIERKRRKILQRAELPFWRILGYFEGTCLKAMSVDILLWVTMVVYISIRIMLRLDVASDSFTKMMTDIGDADISVIGGFLSFFLVLYVNQSNARFTDMYHTSRQCPARIYGMAEMLAGNASVCPTTAQRLIRTLNAAHIAGYVGLSRTYSRQEFFDPLNKQYGFLTPQEMDCINSLDMDNGPAIFHKLIGWCIHDIEIEAAKKHNTNNGDGMMDPGEKRALRDMAVQFRNSMDNLYHNSDQPIHFFYIHFLCLLSTIYLPLFAADNAFTAGSGDYVHWSWDVVSGLIVFVQAIFVIGLRMLGQKMSDPYGNDLEDLSVMHYVTEAWRRSNQMLAAKAGREGEILEAEEAKALASSGASLRNGYGSLGLP